MRRIPRTLLRLSGLVLFAALFLLGAQKAQAASINYGDFNDIPPGTVTFLDVTESSGTDPVPLFGAPSILANHLDFNPTGFVSSSGGASDITDGQLNFGLWSEQGTGLTSIVFGEAGDYTLSGAGTAATQVAAGLNVVVNILAVDGVVLADAIQVMGNTSFSTDLLSGPGIVLPWSLSLAIDLGAALIQEQIEFDLGVTHAEVVLNNQLFSVSEELSVAFIAKKDFDIMPGGPVPEPSSLVLGAMVLIGLLRAGRRA